VTSASRAKVVAVGTFVSAASAALSSFEALRALAVLCGLDGRLRPLLPLTVDSLAMTATTLWLARSSSVGQAAAGGSELCPCPIVAVACGQCCYHAIGGRPNPPELDRRGWGRSRCPLCSWASEHTWPALRTEVGRRRLRHRAAEGTVSRLTPLTLPVFSRRLPHLGSEAAMCSRAQEHRGTARPPPRRIHSGGSGRPRWRGRQHCPQATPRSRQGQSSSHPPPA